MADSTGKGGPDLALTAFDVDPTPEDLGLNIGAALEVISMATPDGMEDNPAAGLRVLLPCLDPDSARVCVRVLKVLCHAAALQKLADRGVSEA